jgi:hypothetical protein
MVIEKRWNNEIQIKILAYTIIVEKVGQKDVVFWRQKDY